MSNPMHDPQKADHSGRVPELGRAVFPDWGTYQVQVGLGFDLRTPRSAEIDELVARFATSLARLSKDCPPISWGDPDPIARGPVIVRDNRERRSPYVVGSWNGPHVTNEAVAHVLGWVSDKHRPRFGDIGEPEIFNVTPDIARRLVTIDPFGGLNDINRHYGEYRERRFDIKPTRVAWKGEIEVGEINEAIRLKRLEIDGNIVKMVDGYPSPVISVHKAVIEPVWYIDGVAKRLSVSSSCLRERLAEYTGDIRLLDPEVTVFLPPLPPTSVYIFGDPDRLKDPKSPLLLRIHDACHGSDSAGVNVCTCRPYMAFAAELGIKMAQQGGVGVIVYNNNHEARAGGEVNKYLIYHLRALMEREDGREGNGDLFYYKAANEINGHHERRFHQLSVDSLILLGLGQQRPIDYLASESKDKFSAITNGNANIVVKNRVGLPEYLVPRNARAEVGAKRGAGYLGYEPDKRVFGDYSRGRDWR